MTAPPATPKGQTDHNSRAVQTVRLRAKAARLARPLVIAAALALTLRGLLYEPYRIPSQSMQPTLEPGDYIFVAKWPYGFGRHIFPLPVPLSGRLFAHLPNRGDIIVFKSPRDNRTDLVKRVIGLPGDLISMHGQDLRINGQKLDVQRASSPNSPTIETLPGGRHIAVIADSDGPVGTNFGPTRVPTGQVFVLGDHRNASTDSRFSRAQGGLGMVPLGNVIGRADVILLSYGPNGFRANRIGRRL